MSYADLGPRLCAACLRQDDQCNCEECPCGEWGQASCYPTHMPYALDSVGALCAIIGDGNFRAATAPGCGSGHATLELGLYGAFCGPWAEVRANESQLAEIRPYHRLRYVTVRSQATGESVVLLSSEGWDDVLPALEKLSVPHGDYRDCAAQAAEGDG